MTRARSVRSSSGDIKETPGARSASRRADPLSEQALGDPLAQQAANDPGFESPRTQSTAGGAGQAARKGRATRSGAAVRGGSELPTQAPKGEEERDKGQQEAEEGRDEASTGAETAPQQEDSSAEDPSGRDAPADGGSSQEQGAPAGGGSPIGTGSPSSPEGGGGRSAAPAAGGGDTEEAPSAEAPPAEREQRASGGSGGAGGGGGSGGSASPEDDPGFQSVVTELAAEGEELQSHETPGSAAGAAQGAACGPPNEAASEAAADRVDELDGAEPQEFNKEAFKAAVRSKIEESLPRTQDEAKNFENSGKLEQVQRQVESQVGDERDRAAGPIAQTNDAPLNTAAHDQTEGTPVEPPPPASAPQVDAREATPDEAPSSETDLSASVEEIDEQMDEADVTEEQLQKGNEAAFDEALAARDETRTSATTGPAKYRESETVILAGAQGEAQTVMADQGAAMAQAHDEALQRVGQAQDETTSKDEAARQRIASDIEKIYNDTHDAVERILGTLETDVSTRFDAGAARANQIFKSYVRVELAKYLLNRYVGSGLMGAWNMLRDAVAGLPDEVNAIYEAGKQRYLDHMDGVLDQIADHVATTLNQAKSKVSEGRQKVADYVEALPEDLKTIGAEAADDIQGRFDELEQSVSDKQTQLVDSLAQRYTESVQALDAEIEEMKAAHRGLWDWAKEKVGGAIQTILDLKALLENTFARCREAVSLVIKDPIGFLDNLIAGVGQGLRRFVDNFPEHLKAGFMEWLTGALGGAGITLPETFDLKGVAVMVMQILGLTKEKFRERAVTLLGEEVVQAIELGSEIFMAVKDGGLDGLWEWIKGQLGQLKDMVMGAITDWLVTNVVQKAITMLLSMLNPASAFVKAVMMIYDVIKFFVERGRQIISLVNAIADSVIAIAQGATGAVVSAVENALARAIPVALGFLAALLNLNGITDKVREVIESIQATVWGAIDWVIEKAKKLVGNLADLLAGNKDGEAAEEGEDDEAKHERMATEAVARLESTPVEGAEAASTAGQEIEGKATEIEGSFDTQLMQDSADMKIQVDTARQTEEGVPFTVTISPNTITKQGVVPAHQYPGPIVGIHVVPETEILPAGEARESHHVPAFELGNVLAEELSQAAAGMEAASTDPDLTRFLVARLNARSAEARAQCANGGADKLSAILIHRETHRTGEYGVHRATKSMKEETLRIMEDAEREYSGKRARILTNVGRRAEAMGRSIPSGLSMNPKSGTWRNYLAAVADLRDLPAGTDGGVDWRSFIEESTADLEEADHEETLRMQNRTIVQVNDFLRKAYLDAYAQSEAALRAALGNSEKDGTDSEKGAAISALKPVAIRAWTSIYGSIG